MAGPLPSDDPYYMTEDRILGNKHHKMGVTQLKAACEERGLRKTGNKVHMQHRLLQRYGHISADIAPPEGGSPGEKAAALFKPPGDKSHPLNEFLITVGTRGDHIKVTVYRRLVTWAKTFCVMGVFCLEYGPEAGRKHGHGAVRCHFPTGGKGGPELKALQEHFRRFLYFKNKEDYIQIETVGCNIAGRKKK